MFGELAPVLHAATPEERANYEQRLAVVEKMQEMEAELRGLSRHNLDARSKTIRHLQTELATIPLQDFLTPRERNLPLLTNYLRFRETEACGSLMEQYFLLRYAAFPKDERLAPLFSGLETLYKRYEQICTPYFDDKQHYETLREACFGELKEHW